MAITRRDFLAATLASPALAATPPRRNVILLILVGGPSQLDTWDPKPDAPSEVRGPFATIATRTPGVRFSELFPRMAAASDRFAVVRSMHHDLPPIHETGLQLVQTGRYVVDEPPTPRIVLPGPIGFCGVNVGRGQAGCVTPRLDVSADPRRSDYGRSAFGDDCLRAARLVESGERFVTVNQFTGVYDTLSWDCHAAGGSLRTTLSDYRHIAPTLDVAFTALIDDLHQRGLLQSTLVIATGEFGRTPHLNRDGGRDHWAGCWSMLMAGGGVVGGSTIGRSDRLGGEPTSDPVDPSWLLQEMLQGPVRG